MGAVLSNILNLFNSFLAKIGILFATLFKHLDEPHEKIIANFVLIILFAIIYFVIFKFQYKKSGDGKVFYTPYSTEDMTIFDAFYFSFVVHFTLGFGDIFPASTLARVAVILHTTLFWFINLVDNELVKKMLKEGSNAIVPESIGVI